jgi:hypothetical protein
MRQALDETGHAANGQLGILVDNNVCADLDHQAVGLAKRRTGIIFLAHVETDFTLTALCVVMRV